MGELEPWIDENFIRSVWFGMGENVNVKMIRDKFSGWVPSFLSNGDRGTSANVRSNAGYCFIDFSSPAAAAKALSLNGSMIPNTSRPFKLNWASGGGLADRRSESRFIFLPSLHLSFGARANYSPVMREAPSTPSSLATSAQRSTSTFSSRSSRPGSRLASPPRS